MASCRTLDRQVWMTETSKRHHSVPRAYLRRFTDDDGLLFQHERGQEGAVQVPPHKAARENLLYAPETGDDPSDDAVEVFLAEHIDGPAVQVIDTIIAGSELADDERFQFSLYLAFQEFRIPRMRDNVLKTMGDVAKTMLQLSGSHPEYVGRIFSEMGEAKSEAEIKKIAGFMARGEYEVNVHKTQWLSLLGVAVDIAPMIAGLPWTVMETGEYEIVTTDAPVVKILTDKRVPRKFAGGWLSPSAEATFALDPCHVLVISQDASEGLRREAPPRWARNVNTRSVGQANRFVYSRSREAWVPRVFNRGPRR